MSQKECFFHFCLAEFIRPTERPMVTYDEPSSRSGLDEDVYSEEQRELSKHIPYDPLLWGNASPTNNENLPPGKHQNKSPPYSPKLPGFPPTKKPGWSWQAPTSLARDAKDTIPSNIGVILSVIISTQLSVFKL